MRVRVYIDGLNFYYGVARPYDIKWIDLEALLRILISRIDSSYTLERIFLFSSVVVGKDARERQENYLKAIKQHSSCIETRMGKFKIRRKSGKASSGEVVQVGFREEKETDVNIACSIVDDAYTSVEKEFEVCCLVSNDGDLSAALRIKQRLNQKTILILPRAERRYTRSKISHPSKSLKQLVRKDHRLFEITRKDMQDCQLPDQVGKYRPPKSRGWQIV